MLESRKALNAFLKGERQLEIQRAEVKLPNGRVSKFGGFLTYVDHQIRFEAKNSDLDLFEGANTLHSSFRSQLVASHNHLIINGCTDDGIRFASTNGYAAHNSNLGEFAFTCNSVTLTFATPITDKDFEGAAEVAGGSMIYSYPEFDRENWIRYQRGCPIWFRSLEARDLTLSIGNIDEYSPRIIGIDFKRSNSSIQERADHCLTALSFLRGTRIEWIYCAKSFSRNELEVFSQSKFDSHCIFQVPLKDNISQVHEDQLLEQFISWSQTGDTMFLRSCLEFFWSTSAVPSVAALSALLSVVIESLVKHLVRNQIVLPSVADDTEYNNIKQRALKDLKPLKDTIAQIYWSKLAGSIGGTPRTHVNDLLSSTLVCSPYEIEIWHRHRHNSVHGDFGDFAQNTETAKQRLFDEQNVLIGMTYKLVFLLIQYTGGYTDYSSQEWIFKPKFPDVN